MDRVSVILLVTQTSEAHSAKFLLRTYLIIYLIFNLKKKKKKKTPKLKFSLKKKKTPYKKRELEGNYPLDIMFNKKS